MSTHHSRPPLRAVVVASALTFAGVLSPQIVAAEGTLAQRLACTPDAVRLCSAAMPNAQAVKTCMISNKSKLSAHCLATFPSETASR